MGRLRILWGVVDNRLETMTLFFLTERPSNLAGQLFVVFQYFVSFAELVLSISGQKLQNLIPQKLLSENFFPKEFCP